MLGEGTRSHPSSKGHSEKVAGCDGGGDGAVDAPSWIGRAQIGDCDCTTGGGGIGQVGGTESSHQAAHLRN